MKTKNKRKAWAVWCVVHNWRIRKRLPRITKLATDLGYIK